MHSTRLLPLALATVLLLAACDGASDETTTPDPSDQAGSTADTGDSAADDTPQPEAVLEARTSFYPLEFVLGRVGGDRVEVTSITPPGIDPHTFELSPHDVAQLGDADLTVYLSGFQPAVDEAIEQVGATSLDVAETADLLPIGHEHADDHDHATDHGEHDPHFWLDPLRLADVAELVADELVALDPEGAELYERNAAELVRELNALDAQYAQELAVCELDTIVVAHEAYGYLTDRYGVHQEGVSGIDPDAEPTPARLAEISAIVAEHGTDTIFVETLLNPSVIETLAADLGVTTQLLDPLETQQDDGSDYLDAMSANLEAIRAAMRCS